MISLAKPTHRSLPTARGRRSIVRSSLPLPLDLCDRWSPIFPEKERFGSPEPMNPSIPLHISKCDGQCPLPEAHQRATCAHIVGAIRPSEFQDLSRAGLLVGLQRR